MTTDPAAIPAMTMTPTGYWLIPPSIDHQFAVRPRPAHRAVMSEAGAWRNLAAKAGIRTWEKHGAHYAPLTGAAAWLAEETAQEHEIIRAVSR